ncbi:MAG: poly(ribitol-phosphate) beta-N-acetylglucosaminyltransferase, partial [Solirubrobacteraceae bacterium]|nr:poly(ribitol-phosphate) beta-N-acetylglucosaminyltransferase [Solirubrobacteraceae bacterium]
MVKVSVIVPVYNPGSNLDDLIRTLLEQSLPAEEYEAIFVDDGSTDGTGARLDALAAEHDFIRVEHIPNSGWPGRPRNVGTDLARGEYVYYVDNDDYLALRALERLHKRARRDDADVVVGKVLGHGKTVPRDLFAEDRKEVTLDWPPLLGLLTPHKLFRRSFLAEHGIRFPEGRTRLEDNHFCVHAYFHTDRVSILTGRPVYHWVRRGDENASLSVDPVVYRAGLTAVLDIVEAHTEPGPQRDRLLAHWLRAKVVRWMGGGGLVSRPPEVSAGLHRELRSLMLERLGPQLDAQLPLSLRVRAAILRHGTLAELRRFADWETGLEAALEVEALQRDAALDVSVSARLPLTFARDGAGLRWVPPAAV